MMHKAIHCILGKKCGDTYEERHTEMSIGFHSSSLTLFSNSPLFLSLFSLSTSTLSLPSLLSPTTFFHPAVNRSNRSAYHNRNFLVFCTAMPNHRTYTTQRTTLYEGRERAREIGGGRAREKKGRARGKERESIKEWGTVQGQKDLARLYRTLDAQYAFE